MTTPPQPHPLIDHAEDAPGPQAPATHKGGSRKADKRRGRHKDEDSGAYQPNLPLNAPASPTASPREQLEQAMPAAIPDEQPRPRWTWRGVFNWCFGTSGAFGALSALAALTVALTAIFGVGVTTSESTRQKEIRKSDYKKLQGSEIVRTLNVMAQEGDSFTPALRTQVEQVKAIMGPGVVSEAATKYAQNIQEIEEFNRTIKDDFARYESTHPHPPKMTTIKEMVLAALDQEDVRVLLLRLLPPRHKGQFTPPFSREFREQCKTDAYAETIRREIEHAHHPFDIRVFSIEANLEWFKSQERSSTDFEERENLLKENSQIKDELSRQFRIISDQASPTDSKPLWVFTASAIRGTE